MLAGGKSTKDKKKILLLHFVKVNYLILRGVRRSDFPISEK